MLSAILLYLDELNHTCFHQLYLEGVSHFSGNLRTPNHKFTSTDKQTSDSLLVAFVKERKVLCRVECLQ